MGRKYRIRLITTLVIVLVALAFPLSRQPVPSDMVLPNDSEVAPEFEKKFSDLVIKGRAPKTGYSRTQFTEGWKLVAGCSVRERILARDLTNISTNDECKVLSGTLNDPYSGEVISFTRGKDTSDDVQIDHVIALSNAWQTGAQQLDYYDREAFANDPLNLLAVDGLLNQQKSDADAATWLPPNKVFRCQYVERQVDIKLRYSLWTTQAENDAMREVLSNC